MPFLDAKALETDPEGLAFLCSVLGGVSVSRSVTQAVVDRFKDVERSATFTKATQQPIETGPGRL